MDFLRSCYSTTMLLWGPDSTPVPVRWFFARQGAAVYPLPHVWQSVPWRYDGEDRGPFPPLGVMGAWSNGRSVINYPGDAVHGSERAFLGEARLGEDPQYVSDEDGALPECRPGQMIGHGGQWQGGSALQCGGPVQVASGGQWQGGSAYVAPEYTLHAAGGQWQGGAAPLSGSPPYTATGGQWQGGAAFVSSALPVYATGGQWQGGAAFVSSALPVYATGGQWQGGTAEQGGSAALSAKGGQWQGGTAGQSGTFPVAATGGQWQGGEAEQWHGCGPPCEVVGWSYSDDGFTTIDVDIPDGLEDDDLLILAVMTLSLDAAHLAFPAEWNLLTENTIPVDGVMWTYHVFICRVGDSPPDPSPFIADGEHCWGALIAVRGAASLSDPINNTGPAVPAVGLSQDATDNGDLLVYIAATAEMFGSLGGPDMFSVGSPVPTQAPIQIWYKADVPHGPTQDIGALMGTGGPWATTTFLCRPCPEGL